MSSKPRILVLQPDKGIAEAIYRALLSMRGLKADVDVALSGDVNIPGIRLRRYDLLIVEHPIRQAVLAHLAGFEDATPVVAVGGAPDGSPRTDIELQRVPLPLSLNLLEESVQAALSGVPEQQQAEEEGSRQDSVG